MHPCASYPGAQRTLKSDIVYFVGLFGVWEEFGLRASKPFQEVGYRAAHLLEGFGGPSWPLELPKSTISS